ncbi:MAG: chemotaxis protein CheD [Pseudomonadota bacterium]
MKNSAHETAALAAPHRHSMLGKEETGMIQVAIGQAKVGRTANVLTTQVGAGVAIGMLWRRGGVCALAHCPLPESPKPGLRLGARFINHAVPSLLVMMGVRPEDRDEVEVFIAGGAHADEQGGTGLLNIASARKYLAYYGLSASQADVGGTQARTVSIDCLDFSCTAEKNDRDIHGPEFQLAEQ